MIKIGTFDEVVANITDAGCPYDPCVVDADCRGGPVGANYWNVCLEGRCNPGVVEGYITYFVSIFTIFTLCSFFTCFFEPLILRPLRLLGKIGGKASSAMRGTVHHEKEPQRQLPKLNMPSKIGGDSSMWGAAIKAAKQEAVMAKNVQLNQATGAVVTRSGLGDTKLGKSMRNLAQRAVAVDAFQKRQNAQFRTVTFNEVFKHADICADIVSHDQEDGDGVVVTNLTTKLLIEPRGKASNMYYIAGLMAKLIELDSNALGPKVTENMQNLFNRSHKFMTDGLRSNQDPDIAVEGLNKAMEVLQQLLVELTSDSGPFPNFKGAEEWKMDSEEVTALDHYVHECALFLDSPAEQASYAPKKRNAFVAAFLAWARLPNSFLNFPFFYIMYHIVYILLFVRFYFLGCLFGEFLQKKTTDGLDANLEIDRSPGNCLRQGGRTFLGVPPQYGAVDNFTFNPDTQLNDLHSTVVPFYFGVMHALLFVFGSVPLPMARGFWRDIAYYFPFMKNVFPIDDHIFVHKYFGYLALVTLFIGGGTWVVTFVYSCIHAKDSLSCTSFDPAPLKRHFLDPTDNVVALRLVVTLTWFLLIPLMRWAPKAPRWLPLWVQGYWFEICFWPHIFVGLASITLALISRFDVFYPVISTWGIYILDGIREVLFRTYHCDLVVHKSSVHLDPTRDNKPTTMSMYFTLPTRSALRGGCFGRAMYQGEAQWLWLKIPSVSRLEWHPFSIASATGNDFLELQVGIRDGGPVSKTAKDNWIKTEDPSGMRPAKWSQQYGKTWTYKVYEQIMKESKTIPCLVRGPYGSPFRLCFKPRFRAAIIIGAGTGLSAVESMMRAMIIRRKQGKSTPDYVWFVWTTRRVDDLLWCWDALNNNLIHACSEGLIDKGENWSPASAMLGFMGVNMFVTRAEQSQMDKFRQMPAPESDKFQVSDWLKSSNRVITGSLASEETHIGKLFS